ncbi:MAG: ABC transporter substrate-binding protein [Pseudomonadota bacterium]
MDRARALTKAFQTEIARLEERRSKLSARKRVLFVLNASGGRLIVGGGDTSADAYLKLAGATNAAAALTGFKPVTAEGVITMAPDAIIVMQGGRDGQTASELIATPAFAATPAGKAKKAIDVNGVRALGFGPRLPGAAADLLSWLYDQKSHGQ